MKKRVIKIFDKVILLLLGFSGAFYSCAKYGDPAAEFQINGTVMDKTGKPIQDIRVVGSSGGELYTNSEGKFQVSDWSWSRNRGYVQGLKLEDIDGEANGGDFGTRKIDVEFTDADLVKRGLGNKKTDKYEKTINVVLRTIDDEPIIVPIYGVKSAPFKE